MPNVNGKKFPYTKEGVADAKKDAKAVGAKVTFIGAKRPKSYRQSSDGAMKKK